MMPLFMRAYVKSRHDHVKDMAACIAYFSLLSLFPLLLGVIAVSSLFLEPADAENRLEALLSSTLPGSAGFVSQNIESVFRLRGAASLASIVILLWSARKIAGAIDRGLNNALGTGSGIPFYWASFRSFGIMLLVSISLLGAVAFATLTEIVPRFDLTALGDRADYALGFLGRHGSSVVVGTIVLLAIYLFVPRQRPQWSDALFGAIVTAIMLECGKAAFAHYVRISGNFETIYGSVSSIIVLLLWFYYSARVFLYGAELIAVRRADREGDGPEDI